MGLDYVELIMAVEEEFDIEISDGDAEKCRTVGDMIGLVYEKVKDRQGDSNSWYQPALERVKKELRDVCQKPDRAIGLKTELQQLIPSAERKAIWQELQKRFEVKYWPGLVRSAWCCRTIFIAGAASGVTVALAFNFGLAVIAAPLIWIAGGILTIPFKTAIPEQCQTVDDLIYLLVKDMTRKGPRTRVEVAWLIKRITMEQLGVTAEEVKDNARFYEDLGAG